MIVPELLFTFFRLFNAGILVFFALHVFKTYAYPFLREQLRAQLTSIHALHESIRLEHARTLTSEQKLQDVQHEVKRLLENIHHWHATVQVQQSELQKKLDQRMHDAQKLYEQQCAQYAQHAVQRQLYTQAFSAARQELTREFKQTKSSAAFIDHLLKQLAEKQ